VLIPGPEADAHQENTTGKTVADFSVYGGGSASPGTIDGIPVVKPPYGSLVAIDLNTGEHLWRIPRGETAREILEHPLLEGVDVGNTGRSGGGSVMVTGTLVLLSGVDSDGQPYLDARDKRTGAQVGRVMLPEASGYGMMSYMHEGVQYVVVQLPESLLALKLPTP
jgi:quinoprotein glucose dehydrogenase